MKDEGKANCFHFILHPSAFILMVKAMLYKNSLRTLLAFLLVASNAVAQSSSRPRAVEAERLRQHVTYLASEKLEGRRTGTSGAQEAARYVAREFIRAGLTPGANAACDKPTENCYMQEFPYVSGVGLGKGNALTATRRADLPGGSPVALEVKS